MKGINMRERWIATCHLFDASMQLQDEADKKSVSSIAEICDACIRANEFYDENFQPYTASELIDDLRLDAILGMGIRLARKAGKKKIYRIIIREACGDSLFYFIGTVPELINKFNKLPNDWM